ncbi:MAG TPA: inositol monophosphatase family protein, partial [Thermoguttaceae bacterium]|nr:inositol monophosphatase family protein [Thermoguttaceae bacterium]
MQEYLDICEKAVRAGGAVVQDWVGRFEVSKKGPADLVTQADLASQQEIRRILLDAYPDHCMLGEEADTSDEPSPTDRATAERTEYRWIVDPLDGTTNYAHHVPHYCVSLALQRNDELLVGAVFDPMSNECYMASAGGGACLNGREIHTSQVSELSESLAVVGFPPNVTMESPDLLVFLEAVQQCQAIRRTGSAALNLCYLAAGRFDVFWSFATKIWDVAAGVLIIREAGGVVTAPEGGDFILEEARFLAAANRPLHADLLEL